MPIVSRSARHGAARLPYGAGPHQFGDLRLPAGAGPHPVAVVVHGGFWRARYDLTHIEPLCIALTAAGLATWNLEYRRIGHPGGGWPGTFHDVSAGTDHLRVLAREYPLDLARVITLGHSAGGHLACWLAARWRLPAGDPLATADPLPLRGAVSLAGVLDLRQAWEQHLSADVVVELLGGTPAEMPGRYNAASPRALLPLGLPQRLLHGTVDPNVPYTISESYATAALAAGDEAQLITLPGAGHFELVDPRSREWTAVLRAALDLTGALG